MEFDLIQNCCFLMAVGYGKERKMRIAIYNLYLENEAVFDDLTEAILFMNKLMDAIKMPPASNEMRQFIPVKDRKKCEYDETQQKPEGLRHVSKSDSVFYIRVFYRKNSSWQGEVRWKEGKKKLYFRSVLELLHLIWSVREEALKQ